MQARATIPVYHARTGCLVGHMPYDGDETDWVYFDHRDPPVPVLIERDRETGKITRLVVQGAAADLVGAEGFELA